MSGHYDAVRVLLAHNADKHIRDSSGRPALEWAERLQYTAILSLLSSSVTNATLEAQLKAEAAAAEDKVHTVASSHCAAQRKRCLMLEKFMKEHNLIKMSELLTAEGDFLSPNYEDSAGISPLLLSCSSGTCEDVLLCLERKCIPTHQNRDGVTALMIACKRGDTAMIGLLIKAGCSLLTRDYSGRDSPVYLNSNDHPALAEQMTNAHRSAGSQPPLACLGTPLMSVEPLRSGHSTDHGEGASLVSEAEGCGYSESASSTDRKSLDGATE